MAGVSPVRTYGLTHIALAVKDPKRSATFYASVFGAKAVYADANVVQVQTPGSRDVIVFEKDATRAGQRGGVVHFGFRLKTPRDISKAAAAISRAGGRITSQGEFVPGEPYVFATDPDGYAFEIWYELPTSVDPK